MPIPRRSHFIIEPLDREKGGIPATPPMFEGHVPTGRKMRDKDRRPAFDPFQYLRIGCGREPANPQNSDAIATVHLGLLRITKGRTDRRRRSDKTAGCKQGHAANQWRLIDCEAPGDPVAEGMSDQVRWTEADCLDDARNVTGQIVQGCAVERAATACNTAHINRDGLKPSGCKHASQIIKITDATARIREQHDWYARTAGCAFQRHVTDFDVEAIEGRRLRFKERRLGGSRTSAGYEARSGSCRCAGEQVTARQSRFGHLIHSLTAWILWCIPRDRPKRSCPSWLTEGEHRPKFLPLDVTLGGRYHWPKPDSIPERESGREAAASIIVCMWLDFAECDRARLARDPAYDGRFYTGVHTTGIYCRLVCPVRPARSANVSFFPSAAAAETAGFRPCLRCRPETAPFCSAWIGSRATVERARRLIAEEGALDQEGATVERLAQRLGVGPRQLTRLFARYLQASPSEVAKTTRVQRAKRLLDETSLPMTEIAMQAGFRSLRRFNSAFVEIYGRPPTEIRRTRRSAGKSSFPR